MSISNQKTPHLPVQFLDKPFRSDLGQLPFDFTQETKDLLFEDLPIPSDPQINQMIELFNCEPYNSLSSIPKFSEIHASSDVFKSFTQAALKSSKTKVPTVPSQLHPLLRLKHRGMTYKNWRFYSIDGPILGTTRLEQWIKSLKIPELPEMIQGHNAFRACFTNGFILSFNGWDACDLIVKNNAKTPTLHVSEEWKKGTMELKKNKNTGKLLGEISTSGESKATFDWTFTSPYFGSICRMDGKKPLITYPSKKSIDIQRLMKQEPMLFMTELVLYEDEIFDLGTAKFTIWFRLMKSYFYILARFALRVDKVMIRLYDTRIFFDFTSSELIYKIDHREALISELEKTHGPDATYSDLNKISNQIPLKNTVNLVVSVDKIDSSVQKIDRTVFTTTPHLEKTTKPLILDTEKSSTETSTCTSTAE